MMQRARRFIQSFADLRDSRFRPGVNLPGDGWDGWRESYAFDGQHLAAYAEHRNGILLPLNIHEIGIVGRKRCFTLHPEKCPRRYTTDNLVRMAKTAHRVLSNPATDVPETPQGPPADALPENAPTARFPHYDDFLPPGFAGRPEVEWPGADARRSKFVQCVEAANRRLAPADARLPDALYQYWTRHWAAGFWRATQHGRPSLEGVRALIEFGDVVHADFRLNDGRGTEPRDVEFTYYDRVPLRENFPFPLGTHAKTSERDNRVSPINFPRPAAPVPGLAPRIRCEEFLTWGGFLAGDLLPTEAQWADLNRVGVDTVGERGDDMVGWCVANGGDVTECQRIANNFVVQLRRQTDAVAEERLIDYALTSESCNLYDVLRTVKQWLRRLDNTVQTTASIRREIENVNSCSHVVTTEMQDMHNRERVTAVVPAHSADITTPNPPTPVADRRGSGGRRPLTESTRPEDVAKVNAYDLIREQKRLNPGWGPTRLRNHFKADRDFKTLVSTAGLKFSSNMFATALAWVKSEASRLANSVS